MSYEQILTDVADGIVTITMNRPEKLNAWTFRMRDEMVHAINEANAENDVVAIVVTGAGRGFCAGADIAEVFKAQADGNTDHVPKPVDWVGLVRESKPMIAAINGAAIGVGLTQVFPMDHLIAAQGAKISLRFVKMGVVPELASSHLVPMRIGFGRASELMLTGRTILAEEAHEIGLVDNVVEPDGLMEAAQQMARAMGENPLASVRFTKQLLTANMSETSLDKVQALELELLNRAYESPEHHEAIAAFMEKREPDFKAAREGDQR